MKKSFIKSLLISTLLLPSIIGTNPVVAENYDQQIEQAQQSAQENEQAAAGLDDIMNQLTQDMSSTQAALDHLNAEMVKNEQKMNQTLEDIQISQQEMNTLLDEIDDLEKNIEQRSVKLEEQARVVQVNGNPAIYIEFILNAESLTDVLGRMDVVTNLVKSSNQMIKSQKRDQESVEKMRTETEQKMNQQLALMEELEISAANLELQNNSQTALLAQIEIEKSSVASEKSALIAKRNEALQLVQSIEKDREEVLKATERATLDRIADEQREEVQNEIVQVKAKKDNERKTAPEIKEVVVSPATSERESDATTPSSNPSSNSSSHESTEKTEPTPPIKKEEIKVEKPKPSPKPTPAQSGNVLEIAGQYTHLKNYIWGGQDPERGFDCSGFTQYVFAQAGKRIPRTSAAQYQSASKITNPQPGDLVFFSGNRNGIITHVGIYVGGNKFIGSQTSTGVAYAELDGVYWGPRFVGYGRY